jgi:hypothetical protein
MKRRLLNLLTIVSPHLFAAACVLWASSYFTAVSLHRQDAGVGRSFMSDGGKEFTDTAVALPPLD